MSLILSLLRSRFLAAAATLLLGIWVVAVPIAADAAPALANGGLWLPDRAPRPPHRGPIPEHAWIHSLWGLRGPARLRVPKTIGRKVVRLAPESVEGALAAGLHTFSGMDQLMRGLVEQGVPLRDVELADRFGFHANQPWFFPTIVDGERVLSTMPTYQNRLLPGGQMGFATIPAQALTGGAIDSRKRRERRRARQRQDPGAKGPPPRRPILAKKGLFAPFIDPWDPRIFALLEPAVAVALEHGTRFHDPAYDNDHDRYTHPVTVRNPDTGQPVTFPMTVVADSQQTPLTFYPDIDARFLAQYDPQVLGWTALNLATVQLHPKALKIHSAHQAALQRGQLAFFDDVLAHADLRDLPVMSLGIKPLKVALKRLIIERRKEGKRLADQPVLATLKTKLKQVVNQNPADLQKSVELMRLLAGQFLDVRYGELDVETTPARRPGGQSSRQ